MDIQKIPTKFIKGSTEEDPTLVTFVAQHLKAVGKNLLPVVLIETGADKYQAIHNSLIWAAAKKANLDFTWGIVIAKDQVDTIRIEAGQLLQVNIAQASQSEITDVLAFARKMNPKLAKIDPELVSEKIIAYRATQAIKSLTFLTKQKCNVGDAKVPLLQPYFTF